MYLEATSQIGGAERVLIELLERLPRELVEPHLICPEPGALTDQAQASHIPLTIESLPNFASTSRVFGERKIIDPFAVLRDFALVVNSSARISRRLRQEHFDLIHTNSFFAHLYGGLAAKRLGIPCAWHLHDMMETNRFGGLAGFLWRWLGNNLPSRIIGSSKCALEAFDGSDKAVAIYAGVMPTYAPKEDWLGWRAQLNLTKDSILVGYVGRIGWVKGLDILVRAAKQAIVVNPRIHFVVIGGPLFGEHAYAESITQQVKSSGLGQNWHPMGYYADASQRLHDLDCLVLPSRRESLPRVLLEAGMAGVPVVASRVGGIPEVIESGVNGVLVEPEDPGALADALLSLLGNQDRARLMGENARQKVIANFDIQQSVNAFYALYREMLGTPTAPMRPHGQMDKLRLH